MWSQEINGRLVGATTTAAVDCQVWILFPNGSVHAQSAACIVGEHCSSLTCTAFLRYPKIASNCRIHCNCMDVSGALAHEHDSSLAKGDFGALQH